MSLTNAQKSLIKQAQRQAGLSDEEYRESLFTITRCHTSKAPELTNRDFDRVLSYFEAIINHRLKQGNPPPAVRGPIQPGRRYWQTKNTRQETSRDRYGRAGLEDSVEQLEAGLAALGYGDSYCAAIKERATGGRTGLRAERSYAAALTRTLAAKQRQTAAQSNPF